MKPIAAVVVAVSVLVAACGHLERLSENPTVQLVVAREGSRLTVHSALWPSPETHFLVCPGALPSLRPNLTEAASLAALVPPCADLGRHALGPDDDATLELAGLPADARARLDHLPDWYLVLLGLGGEHVLRHVSVIDGGPIEQP